MDQLHLMTAFAAVAEEESFAKAARSLGLSPPAVTRAINALEQHLGVKLLQRTTRFVRVTETGARYFEDVRRILNEIKEAEEAAARIHTAPRGNLFITAPVLFGRLFVLPVIIEYLQYHPQTSVSSMFLDRVVNLLEEGFDVGVRIGDLPDSSLRAIRVASVTRVLCASPDYLQRHGLPKKPADLVRHTLISASGVTPTHEWRFAKGSPAGIRVSPRLIFNTNDAAVDAAVRGFGIVRLLSYQIAPQLASGQLKLVLRDYDTRQIPVHVLHREGRHASAKVRSFLDLAVERLRNQSL